MRERRWSDRVESESMLSEAPVSAAERPTLRSSHPYKKVKKINQSFVVNLEMLSTALGECMNCTQGPLDLRNSYNVRPEGVCPVLKIKCPHCEHINNIRPAEHAIIECLQFLARQGLAFQGSIEEESNFSQLLQLRAKDRPELLVWLNRTADKYTSHEIQNELIAILASRVIQDLVSDIQKAIFFALICDEYTDISNKE